MAYDSAGRVEGPGKDPSETSRAHGRGPGPERIEEAGPGPATATTGVPEPVRDHPIMTRRSRGREVALQVLYQVEQNAHVPLPEVRRFIQRRLLADRKLCEFTEGLIAGVKEHQVRIDTLISEAAENWRLDRMAAIDRNILRLGVYEMMFSQEVPARVAINEALELAKRYSTAQSSRFVNGILDRLLQSELAPSRPAREPDPGSSEPEPGQTTTDTGPAAPDANPPDSLVPTDETPPE
jgi:transcription antitermination protein NusB